MKLTKEVKVGLLATVALTTFYLSFNFLKGSEIFSFNNSYHTIYDNCMGLSTASPVLLNGKLVGRVRKIEILPNKEHSVFITFETKKNIKLTDASKAQLISPSLLGDKAINLLIAEGSLLKNHDTVPGQIEQSFGDTFMEGTLPVLQDAKDISLLVAQFVAKLVENTDKISSIFTNLEDTTHQLRKSINENQQAFNALSQNMNKVSSALADSKDGVRPLLTKFNQLMDEVESKELAEKVNSILGSVVKVFNNTEQGSNNLSKLLYDDSFYNNLNQTVVDLDKILVDLKAYPWRYLNFSVFGKKQDREEPKKE